MTIDISQAAGLASPFVSMTEEEAQTVLSSRYALIGEPFRFATEKDDTFRVRCSDGSTYVLKISNPAEAEPEISLQAALLRHLAVAAPELRIPRIVHDLDELSYSTFVDAAGQDRLVRLMTYVDGTPLSELHSTPTDREKVGESLAMLRLAMEGFSHHADTREIAWDVRHLRKLAPLLDAVDDTRRRAVLEEGLRRFREIEPILDKCRVQMVHNDFSKSNIVVDRSLPEFVPGIIDFGDAVRTAVAIDVSTALLNQLPPTNQERLFADGKDLLRGYLRVADLTETEIELVPHLVMARIVARALLTTWRASLLPENATYILRNTAQGWSQMEWFLERSLKDVSTVLL